MATTSVKFTNFFEDGTTSDLVIGDFNPEDLQTNVIKQRVKLFNEQMETSDFPKRLQSKNGANWQKISQVQLITAERVYFF